MDKLPIVVTRRALRRSERSVVGAKGSGQAEGRRAGGQAGVRPILVPGAPFLCGSPGSTCEAQSASGGTTLPAGGLTALQGLLMRRTVTFRALICGLKSCSGVFRLLVAVLRAVLFLAQRAARQGRAKSHGRAQRDGHCGNDDSSI